VGHRPRYARDSRLEQLLVAAFEESPRHLAISPFLLCSAGSPDVLRSEKRDMMSGYATKERENDELDLGLQKTYVFFFLVGFCLGFSVFFDLGVLELRVEKKKPQKNARATPGARSYARHAPLQRPSAPP